MKSNNKKNKRREMDKIQKLILLKLNSMILDKVERKQN